MIPVADIAARMNPIVSGANPRSWSTSGMNGKNAAAWTPISANRTRIDPPSVRATSAEPRDEAARVLRVDLPQHVVGEAEARDRPPSLRRRLVGRVGEVLVLGLEEPEVDRVGARGRRGLVGPEH